MDVFLDKPSYKGQQNTYLDELFYCYLCCERKTACIQVWDAHSGMKQHRSAVSHTIGSYLLVFLQRLNLILKLKIRALWFEIKSRSSTLDAAAVVNFSVWSELQKVSQLWWISVIYRITSTSKWFLWQKCKLPDLPLDWVLRSFTTRDLWKLSLI